MNERLALSVAPISPTSFHLTHAQCVCLTFDIEMEEYKAEKEGVNKINKK